MRKCLIISLLVSLGTATSLAQRQQDHRSWWLSFSAGQKVAVANGYLVGMDHASVLAFLDCVNKHPSGGGTEVCKKDTLFERVNFEGITPLQLSDGLDDFY